MLELLANILLDYGLELNMAKTMILSTCPAPDTKTFVEVCNAFAEILGKNGSHKYLGRAFSGNLQDRGKVHWTTDWDVDGPNFRISRAL